MGTSLAGDASYSVDCKYGSGQTGIYHLIINAISPCSMHLSKTEYVTGKVLYIKKLPGSYYSDY